MNDLRVLVCGGGNGAHVLAGVASSQAGVEVRVLTLFADEAARWNAAMSEFGFEIQIPSRTSEDVVTLSKQPSLVTKDPAQAASGCDVIIFVVPAFAHAQYLETLEPYIKPGVILVGLPGMAGFEFAVRGILGDKSEGCTLMSFESLPWACRIKEFGKIAEVIGTKLELVGAVQPGKTAPSSDPTGIIQRIIGKCPVLKTHGHLLGMTFMATNAYIHPSIMYGKWHDWDGEPVDELPLFYHGLDQNSAAIMSGVSDEILNLAKILMNNFPSVDLSNVSHIFDWYRRCYADDISDKTSLLRAIQTNGAYVGLKHPMTKTVDGKYLPDFRFRYFTEDIPFGLLVIRGVAELVGAPTPNIDRILYWAQRQMNREYITDGQVQGKDLGGTRTPQRYGLNSIEAVLHL